MFNEDEEYEGDNPYGLETDSDFHRTRKSATLGLIQEFTAAGSDFRLLDVGCGKGLITKSIHERFTAARITGIDISWKAIELARHLNPEIRFSVADGMTYSGEGEKFDLILLNNIYEHVENPAGMLLNLKQLLSPDGVFVISTPNRYHIKNLSRKLFGLPLALAKYHVTEYSVGQLCDHHTYAELTIREIGFPKFRRERFRMTDFIFFTLLQPLADGYLRMLGSKTRTGELVLMVSAQKKN
jgi:SAM-dependent methyltransferase